MTARFIVTVCLISGIFCLSHVAVHPRMWLAILGGSLIGLAVSILDSK